jgi:hypothetical protein
VTETTIDLLAAFAVTWLGGLALARVIPVPSGDFVRHLRARVVRMLGRVVILVTTLIVGIGVWDRGAAAVTIGALAGWLVDAGREAWRCHVSGEDRR